MKSLHEIGRVGSASTEAEEVLDRLFALTVAMSDAMEQDLTKRGLSRARATVITILRRAGAMTQRELADALRVTPRNVTGLVDALERDELVTRSPHPRDRRATLVTLAERGVLAARSLEESHQELAAFLLARLAAAELAGFGDTLERLIARLGEPEFARLRSASLERWRALVDGRRP